MATYGTMAATAAITCITIAMVVRVRTGARSSRSALLCAAASALACEILQSEGIEVVDKPTFFQSPDVEQIAAVHPDRILLSDVGSLTSITAQARGGTPRPTITPPSWSEWLQMWQGN
ncbi:MAG: hypothetical protein WA972_08590 [Rhodococcus qingshengii]